jgi:hypothetical protein
VAWRWRLAWPAYVEGQWLRQPTDEEIGEILARPERKRENEDTQLFWRFCGRTEGERRHTTFLEILENSTRFLMGSSPK